MWNQLPIILTVGSLLVNGEQFNVVLSTEDVGGDSSDVLNAKPLKVHLDKGSMSQELLKKLEHTSNIVFADLPGIPEFINSREYSTIFNKIYKEKDGYDDDRNKDGDYKKENDSAVQDVNFQESDTLQQCNDNEDEDYEYVPHSLNGYDNVEDNGSDYNDQDGKNKEWKDGEKDKKDDGKWNEDDDNKWKEDDDKKWKDKDNDDSELKEDDDKKWKDNDDDDGEDCDNEEDHYEKPGKEHTETEYSTKYPSKGSYTKVKTATHETTVIPKSEGTTKHVTISKTKGKKSMETEVLSKTTTMYPKIETVTTKKGKELLTTKVLNPTGNFTANISSNVTAGEFEAKASSSISSKSMIAAFLLGILIFLQAY